MINYFKTQWFNLLIGLVDIGLSLYNLVQGDNFMAAAWMISAVVWLIMSRVDYNDDRIQLLEKKQERDDAMYNLVQELLEANKIDREHMKLLEDKVKKLEGKK